MRRKEAGFTMVEILTVIGIIAILIAVLIPTLTTVRNMARRTQQRAQLTVIDLALIAFKADYGDYPPSIWTPPPGGGLGGDYGGAQKLAEALLGWDLLGFHPESAWRSDGEDENGTERVYDLTGTDEENEENLRARRGPYLELAGANAFRLGKTAEQDGLFDDPTPLEEDTFVLCDVFSARRITLSTPSGRTVNFNAGTPILYYRANTSYNGMDDEQFDRRIYNIADNFGLIGLGSVTDSEPPETHPYAFDPGIFYEAITDPRASTNNITRPYRPDSYILISAGRDGLYGTSDDIYNF